MRKKKSDDRDPFFKTLNILSPFRYSKTRHIRVADILVDEELGSETDGYDCSGDFNMDGDPHHLPEDDGFMALQCSSPRRIISRWLSTLKRGKRRRCDVVRSQKRPKDVAETERERETSDESTHATCPTTELNGGGEETESRQIVKNTSSFNLGVTCGLVFLIVASKNELAKTAELRAEMEQLLQKAKEELQSKNSRFDSRPVASNEMNFASSTTDLQQASSSSSSSESRFSLRSGMVQEVRSEYVRNGGEGEGERDEGVEGMDQLEAELEAELERLQLHLELDSESHSSNSNYRQQQRLKAVQDTARGTGEDFSDFGEEIDAHETEPADHNEIPCDYGVPALELEGRLHELLEARQEERIKELEVALEYTKRKLHEKEMEVSWWRQNASAALTSHHHRDPSWSGASQHSSGSTFHLFR